MLPAAIAGAKGSGCLLASLPVRTAAAPYNAPIKTEKKKAAASIFTPSIKPITANNLISPPPIPPWVIAAIKDRKRNPAAAPNRLAYQESSGEINLAAAKKGRKKINIRFGISIK